MTDPSGLRGSPRHLRTVGGVGVIPVAWGAGRLLAFAALPAGRRDPDDPIHGPDRGDRMELGSAWTTTRRGA
ncbi:hypothetical protein [Nocardia sp. NPDC050412]|uniref:hypothetical protein n=1 Tax=Nocardia sp. NPDC050412 TaxID=3364320 RepID=UPI003790CB4F